MKDDKNVRVHTSKNMKIDDKPVVDLYSSLMSQQCCDIRLLPIKMLTTELAAAADQLSSPP